jgi:hypothetical protein
MKIDSLLLNLFDSIHKIKTSYIQTPLPSSK